ncbi:MAG: Sapep family Mn(2+)-dependent dipeptidase [Bacilli bacterium]|nr:Sapep family Mn(2+)-dependent dipeptidase [Bacilli bacterium]
MKFRHTKYDDLVKPYQEDLFKSLKEFVAIDSVYDEDTRDDNNPFGKGVSDALNYIKDLANKDGFTATNYDNMVVEILCGEGDKNITILAHADVVPEGKGWDHPPFKVTEKDGVLTGRGVSDDKGPLLETYYALKALRDNHLLGNYQVRFIVGGNEESGSLGVKHYFRDLKKKQPTIGFSPDADFPLIYTEKGIRNFKVKGKLDLPNIVSINGGLAANSVIEECHVLLKEKDNKLIDLFKARIKELYITPRHDGSFDMIVFGKSAHGSTPELGINAGILALEVLDEYYDNKDLHHLLKCYKDVYGKGIDAYYVSENMDGAKTSMNIGLMEYKNGVFSMVCNYRYVDTCNIEETTKRISEVSRPFEIEVLGDSKLLFFQKNDDIVRILLKAYQEESGDFKTPILAIGGGTYAKEADNIIAFGAEFPDWDSKMHGVGEGCRKSDMIKAMGIYARAIKDLGDKLEEK